MHLNSSPLSRAPWAIVLSLLALTTAMLWRMSLLAGLPLLLGTAWWLGWPWRKEPLVQRLLWLISGLGLLQLSVETWSVLFPFVLSFLVAYLLEPLIARLERKFGRARSAALVLAFFLLATGLTAALLIPVLVEEGSRLLRQIPQITEHLTTWTQSHLPSLLASLGLSDLDVINFLREKGPLVLGKIFSFLGNGGQNMASWLSSASSTLLGLLLIPFLVYSCSLALHHLRSTFKELLPPAWKPTGSRLAKEIDRILAGYVRGQLMVSTTIATLTWLGLALAGVPYPLLLGMAAGVLNLVPYLGITTVWLITSAVALASMDPFTGLWRVSLVFVVVQSLEGWVVSPRLLGGAMGLGPVQSLFCLLFFGSLFGVGGMLVALPLGAFLLILLRQLHATYLASIQSTHGAQAHTDSAHTQ